jgi:hypothetical protein
MTAVSMMSKGGMLLEQNVICAVVNRSLRLLRLLLLRKLRLLLLLWLLWLLQLHCGKIRKCKYHSNVLNGRVTKCRDVNYNMYFKTFWRFLDIFLAKMLAEAADDFFRTRRRSRAGPIMSGLMKHESPKVENFYGSTYATMKVFFGNYLDDFLSKNILKISMALAFDFT